MIIHKNSHNIDDEEEQQLIERKAISIYIQIHQRYIMSDTGIRKIVEFTFLS